MARPQGRRNVALNRKARFEYELLEHVEAGIVLLGSEVKSLRSAGIALDESYVAFDDRGRPMLLGARIAPYEQANRNNHDPMRPKPLLMHAEEIQKFRVKARDKGLSIVPVQLYFEGPWCKVEIALGRGKKLHDKRASIREREDRRDVERALRSR